MNCMHFSRSMDEATDASLQQLGIHLILVRTCASRQQRMQGTIIRVTWKVTGACLKVKVVCLTLWTTVCDHDGEAPGIGVLIAPPLNVNERVCQSSRLG